MTIHAVKPESTGVQVQPLAGPVLPWLVLPQHDFVLCKLPSSWLVPAIAETGTVWTLLLLLGMCATKILQRTEEFCYRLAGCARTVILFVLGQMQLVKELHATLNGLQQSVGKTLAPTQGNAARSRAGEPSKMLSVNSCTGCVCLLPTHILLLQERFGRFEYLHRAAVLTIFKFAGVESSQ